MAVNQRPPHLVPGQNEALRSQIVLDSPLELWRGEIARRGVFTAEKLAALAVVLGIIFSQVGFIQTAAKAAPDEISGTVFEDIVGDGLNDGAVGDANNPGLAGVPMSLFRDEAATQTADSGGEVGQYASIAIGSDGNPVVAYGDMSNGDLKVLHCDDPSCATYSTTTVESAGSVGQSVSLAIGADGFPIISHYDYGNLDLRVYKCSNAACTAGSGNAVDTAGSQGSGSSIAIGTDGLPIISYFDGTAYDLKVAHCNDAACATSTITAIDTASTTGAWSSIAIGSDGLAVVSYRLIPSADLKVSHCDNVACTSGTSTVVDTTGDLAGSSSIAQGSDGFPAVAYFDLTNKNLKFAHCTNLTCTAKNITIVDSFGDVGYNPAVAIGLDGNPIIAHYDFTNTALKLTYCDNLDCSSSSSSTPDSAGNVGSDPSLTLDAGGSPVVAYFDEGNYDLKIATAANGAPDAGDTFLSTTTTDANGVYTFSGLGAGDYLVAVESTAIAATAGYDTAQGDSWAEQSYGPAGSLCANGSGGTLTRSTAGACYGGADATSSDAFDSASPNITAAEHVAVIVAGAAAADFGFSFNVVTNTEGGDTRDADPTAARTVQGSLRQFIQNANGITGTNAMRFVPSEPTNNAGGGGTWWRLLVTAALPTITGDGTTIDGTALDFTDGTTVLNTNAAQIGAGVAVGTDGTYTTPRLDPELEIQNHRPTAVLPTGLVFEADYSVLRHVSIWGFGDSASTFDANVVFGTNFNTDPDFTGSLAEFNVIGTGPASFTDPGAADRSGQMNITMRENDNAIVRDNLIGFAGGEGVATSSASNSLSVLRNEIRRNGIIDPIANPVSVWISGGVTGNLITDNASGVFSGPTLWITYEDNTITANGWGGTRPHGIQVSGSPTTIQRNVIADNAGSGVVPDATDTDVYITRNSMYGNGTVTGSIGIDLLASGDDSQAAPFVTLNDAGDGDTGSNGLLNFPVVDTARIEGSDLVVTGWTRPGTTIEFYLADSDPSGFGEGETWLISKIEGSADDTDATTGTYGPGAVNGIAQGTDTTNRFAFTIPTASLAAAVAGSDQLTAVATSGTNTSEFGGRVTITAGFVVNSTGDGDDVNPGNGICETSTPGQCTLRAAITEANALAGTDTINFNIPTSEPGYQALPLSYSIRPASWLPAITQPVVIDGSTQPDYTGTPIVVLNGNFAPQSGDANGLNIQTSDSTIRGLVLIGWGDDAIEIEIGGNNAIAGNHIGVDVTGAADSNDYGLAVKSDGNTIGGTTDADRNVISGNLNWAIGIYNAVSGNAVLGNSIYGNGALGIDLGDDGVTANDSGDGDSGDNNLLNFPVITSATETGGTVTVDFDLDVPVGDYRIEFFDNTAADPSGNGEGETFVDVLNISHPGGSASYGLTFAGSVGDILTATATEGTNVPFGSTSEFSAANTVTPGNAPPAFDQNLGDRSDAEASAISLSASATDSDVGDTLTYSATGLPIGLSIDSGTGLITGIVNHAAAASSPYATEISVSDGVNPAVLDTFTWTITNVPTSDPYLVAGAGGVGGGDDLLTTVDETSFDPATNEVDIGTGTGTSGIEAAAIEPLTGDLYAIDGGQLGVLNVDSGAFIPVGAGLGTGGGEYGAITFDNATGMTFHPLTGDIWAVHSRPGLIDVLFVIDPATGAHIADRFGAGVDYIKLRQHSGATDYTALAFDPTDWQLYGVVTDGAGTDYLVRVRRRNGNARIAGSLAQPLTDLSFDATGQLWGIDGSSLYQVNKRTAVLDAGRTIDNGSNYGALAFAVPPAYPPSFEGTVFEDIDGDALAAAQFPSDVDNPGVSGVTVNLYRDDGTTPGEPDAADTLFDTKITGPTGKYFFEGVPNGTYYVAIDSTTVNPTAGGSGWAEQTYGPIGAATLSGTYSYAVAAGPLYGGKQANVSDSATDASTAEHAAQLSLSGGAYVEDVDFGFSFNVVTNVEGGDVTSPQGSLRRFIGNANTVDGPNVLRFVPAVATTSTDGSNDWWMVAVTQALPAIATADTTLDGTAYDSSDGVTVLDSNLLGPELELNGAGTGPSVDGLLLSGGAAEVRGVVINRFGRDAVRIISAGNTVAGNYIGADATGAAGLGNTGNGVSVSNASNNQIGGDAPSDGNLLLDNVAGIWVTGATATDNAVLGNSISGSDSLGIDLSPAGVNANDGDDGDAGPNDLLNYPVISSGTETGGTVTLAGTFDVPAGTYRFEFFTNTAAHASSYGEGETLVGSAVLVHTGSGPEPFGAAFPGSVGDIVTATITEGSTAPYGSTSEFSATYTVTPPNSPPIAVDDPPVGSYIVSEGGWAAWAVMGNDSDPDGDTLLLDSFTQPSLGTVTRQDGGTPGDLSDDSLRYDAPIGSSGSTTFAYTISDGALADVATVSINVIPANSPPTAVVSGPYTIAEGEVLVLDGSGSSDPDGDSLTYNWDVDNDGQYDDATGVNPTVAWATLVGLGIDDDGGPLTIGLEVDDGNTGVDTATGQLTVTNTAPIISVTGSGSVAAGSPYTVNLGVSDPGADTVTQWTINWGDGSVETIPGNPATYDHTYANANFTYDITASVIDDDGTWWNTDIVVPYWEAGNMVIRYDSQTGTSIADIGATSSIVEPHTVAYGPDGFIYVSDDLSDTIERYNPATNSHESTFVSSNLGGLDEPRGIVFGPDGDLFVASYLTSQVLRFNPDGSFDGVFVASGEGGLSGPTGLEFGPNGDLYLTDTDNDTVERFDGKDGTHVATFSSHQNNGILEDLTFAPDGSLYVSVLWSDEIDHVDTGGTIIGSVAVTAPTGLGFGPDGMLWASSMTTDSVVRINPATDTVISTPITEPPIAGPTYFEFIADHQVRCDPAADVTPPVITLLGADPQTIEVGTAYSELGATALDVVDGDVTGSIVVDATGVDTGTVGSYIVTYDVSDSAGNGATQVTRTVNVVDTTAPVITLLGADPQIIEVGAGYSELDATASDNYDGDISASIVVDASGVDPATVGSYLVIYDVDDAAGNSAATVTRTVNVVDTTAPVITLLGADPVTVEVGTAYVDAGATASDVGDGDLTGSIVTANPVDHFTVGSYLVTYDVDDAAGNSAATVTRTVDVVDTTAPVITLLGADPQIIEVGAGYSELGAIASDNYDGDVSASIVADSSAVDTATVGSYIVTYDVSDSAGNGATQVTRTVNVVDTTAPTITLLGADPQTIEVGTAYSELGATALDVVDGDVTGSIVVDATGVDTGTVGSYIVTYDVDDAAGNSATQVTRTVNVVDTTAPVITLLGADPQTIEVGSGYSELGATANDVGDGDLTASIVIDATGVNTNLVGSYLVTYDVDDVAGNSAAQVTRTVNVVDTTAPVITLLGADPQIIEVGAGYSELGATASDNYDGDVSASIVADASGVDTATVGSYLVTYDVDDAAGNSASQVPRTVNVVDTTAPIITLVGADPQVVLVDTAYTELGATAFDVGDGDVTASIVIDSTAIDTSTVGSYTVTYDASDAAGNAATQVTRTVNVVDTTLPVITLLGADPQIIEVGSAYTELGATAADNYDGDLTVSIVIDSSAVNPAVVGSYTVSYDVTDSQGNDAVQLIRTVNVVDTTLPVITLLGADPQIIEVGSAYTELGATAADNYDGDLTVSIVIDSSAVNPAVVGSYTVTYDVIDAAGNVAVRVTRTVNVVDTALPVITLLGANPQTIEVGTAYTELGATAADGYDGDITASIVIDPSGVNTSTVGSYLVTYDIVDSSGNPATALRTVDVVDTTPPVITLVGADPQTIEVGAGYSEFGATALDSYDGDISGAIVIDSSAVNTGALGSYIVTYDVADGEGNNAAQVTRTVTVVDTTAPIITLLGANPQSINVTSPYVELGATAADNYDGDISGSIVIDATAVNTAVVGSYTVAYDVIDGEGNPAAQVTRTVNVLNVAPTLGVIAAQSSDELAPATFTATATDPDPSDSLTFSLQGAPAGAAIDAVSGTFTWTPVEIQGPNTYFFDVVVTDGGAPALTDSQTVTFTVAEVNVAPSIGAIGGQSVAEQTTLTLPVAAADPDLPANTLLYSLAGSPAGVSINASGTLTWTPTEAQGPGVYTFDVIVTDGSLGDIAPVTVTVGEVNVPPTITNPGAQSSAEGDAAAVLIAAADSDVPSNTLSYSAIGLPAGLVIDAATGQIDGTIGFTANASSPHTVTVSVVDNGTPSRSVQTTFSWAVADTNRSPVGTADSVTVAEDTTATFAAAANDSDPDGDPVAVTSVGAPSHGSASLVGTAIAYTPNPNYFGVDSFDYSLSDGRGGVATGTVAVTVTPVNDAPVLVAPATLQAVEHQEVAFSASAGDIEGDTVTFSVVGAPPGAVINASSGSFTWTPGESHGPGSYPFDVVATDDGIPSLATSRTVRVTVDEANSAPTITNPGAQTSAENQPVSLAIVATDGDTPANAVEYSAAGLPPGLSINRTTGVIAGTPSFVTAAGSPYSVTVTVTDDGSPQMSSSVSFAWNIANTNRPPVAISMTVFATAGVPSSLFLTATDPDGDTLSFALDEEPAKGLLTGGPRRFDYTAAVTASGTDQFTFTVSDGEAQATGTVTVSITPNLAPTGVSDEYTVRRGGVLTVDAPGLLGNDRDPEGEPIGAVLGSAPTYGTLALSSDGSFVYTHGGSDVREDVFTYVVDDGMRVSVPILVRIVIEDNRAPVAVADSLALDEDSVAVFHPLTNDYDPNDEAVALAGVSKPQNGTVEWRVDGALVYRPDKDWNGTDSLTYEVTDGELTSVGSVSLRVRPVNDAPLATDVEVTGDSGTSIIIELSDYVNDVDGDQLSFLVEQPPVGGIREIEPGVFEIDLDGVVRDLGPLAFIVTDPSDARATSLLRVIVRIPAELVGVPSLVADDLDPATSVSQAGGPTDPPGAPLVTGLRLMVGSMFETFQALRIPLGFLLLFVLVSLYLGFSRRFAFSSSATAMPLGERKRVDIVMAPSQAGVPGRSEPGTHQPVIYRFLPDEAGIITTGARMMVRSEVWIEVDTPDGDAWVDAGFLTEQVSAATFATDSRPAELVKSLVNVVYEGGDLLGMTAGHDLHVALYGPPVRFTAGSLRRLLAGNSVYWWWGPDGDTPKHQGTFTEVVSESVGTAYRNRDAHLADATFPIPVEFTNMHSLVVGNDGMNEGWRIFFRYENDEPSIAGLMREVAPNPASMHGLVGS